MVVCSWTNQTTVYLERARTKPQMSSHVVLLRPPRLGFMTPPPCRRAACRGFMTQLPCRTARCEDDRDDCWGCLREPQYKTRDKKMGAAFPPKFCKSFTKRKRKKKKRRRKKRKRKEEKKKKEKRKKEKKKKKKTAPDQPLFAPLALLLQPLKVQF